MIKKNNFKKSKNKIIIFVFDYFSKIFGRFIESLNVQKVTIIISIFSILISALNFLYTRNENNKVFVNSIMPYLVLKSITNVSLDKIPSDSMIIYANLCDESYYKRTTNSNIDRKFYKLTLSNIGNGNLKNLAIYDFNTAKKGKKCNVKNIGSSLHEDNILSFSKVFDENSVYRNFSNVYIEKNGDIDIYLNCLRSDKIDQYLYCASIIIYQDLYDNIYTDFLTLNTVSTQINAEGFEFGFFKDKHEREGAANLFTISRDTKLIIDYVLESYKKEYKN